MYCTLCARCCSKHYACINPFNAQITPMRKMLFFLPHFKDELKELAQDCTGGISIQASGFQNPLTLNYCIYILSSRSPQGYKKCIFSVHVVLEHSEFRRKENVLQLHDDIQSFPQSNKNSFLSQSQSNLKSSNLAKCSYYFKVSFFQSVSFFPSFQILIIT